MRQKRLLWHLYPSYLLVILVFLILIAYFSSQILSEYRLTQPSPETEAGLRRGALPSAVLEDARTRIIFRIVVSGMVTALAALVVSLIMARRINRPLEEMRQATRCFAAGDLMHRIPTPVSREMAALTGALNQMAVELKKRLDAILCRHDEQQAVLASMVEGVFAVDAEERFISMNQAAARLLQVGPSAANGRILHEVVRNVDLQKFVALVLSSRETTEGEVVLHHDGETGDRYLQAHGAVLQAAGGENTGAVIVLNDVTDLRRLETVRRDFVANVSHELKTPVTSIKGFVETLLEGALNDRETALRFLQIIARQADRLGNIIEDLLTLSRIEQGVEKEEIALEFASVGDVIAAAVQVCRVRAMEKNVEISVTAESDLKAAVNAPLLEQAIINLIDNAVKYSEPGSLIRVEAVRNQNEAIINVTDQGCGIAPHHLPRIFERFYRVDKARSRSQGGTGLGLAIVKHIAQAHHGEVRVESTLGKGSRFAIHIPLRINNNRGQD